MFLAVIDSLVVAGFWLAFGEIFLVFAGIFSALVTTDGFVLPLGYQFKRAKTHRTQSLSLAKSFAQHFSPFLSYKKWHVGRGFIGDHFSVRRQRVHASGRDAQHRIDR